MLHHHGGGAGSPSYMAPTAAGTGAGTLSPTPAGPAVSAAAIPAPPPTTQLQPAPGQSANFEELAAGGGSGAGAGLQQVQDDDMQADLGGSGGAGASGSGGGNRWPREETLALIRIRTEMDADFRNAALKAPLWEDVARKLAALGYHRSAKKCKEKFENVDKYYRRTKDARAGRQDGKSYRFFSQLEALHAAAPPRPPPPMTAVQAAPPQPVAMAPWTALGPAAGAGLPDLSFSSMSGSDSEYDSDSDSDDDDGVGDSSDDDAGGGEGQGTGRGGGYDGEMMAIFEGMMRQVTEKQDAMQRAFLETLERWEAERTAREEAWRRQEVARINRERDQLARERAAAASRDAALIAFLQRVGGGPGQPLPPPAVRLPPRSAGAVPAPVLPDGGGITPPSPRPDDAAATSLLQQHQQLLQLQLVPAPPPPLKAVEALVWAGGGEGSGGSTPSSSRWPKEEVEALIEMRNEKDAQYHDAGAKGPLWEDIAAGMRRIGYNRSAKRCKEKWENINKYYKKVKESNKRRPEDSKTCPYFHQLDAMYLKKHRGAGAGAGGGGRTVTVAVAAAAPALQVQDDNPSQREIEGKSSNDVDSRKNDEQGNVLHTSPGNGDPVPGGGAKNKTAEDNVTETETNAPQLRQQQQEDEEFGADETESDDDMARNYTTVYTEEDDDEDKMEYKMGFRKPNAIGSSSDVPAPSAAAPPAPATATATATAAAAATAAAPTTSSAPTSSTFLAVQ